MNDFPIDEYKNGIRAAITVMEETVVPRPDLTWLDQALNEGDGVYRP